jgi:hypothetical protein
LIFAIGREITPYNAAEAYFKAQDENGKPSPSELGAWYTCKKKLLKEKLLTETKTIGRDKLIKTDTKLFFETAPGELPKSGYFFKENLVFFEKYAPKIVDFFITDKWFTQIDDPYLPLAYYFLIRYLVSIRGQIEPIYGRFFEGRYLFAKNKISGRFLNSSYLFVKEKLSESEKQELSVHGVKEQKKLMFCMLTILPSVMFKETILEVGVEILNTALTKKQLFDELVDMLDMPAHLMQEYSEYVQEFRRIHDI